MGGLGGVQVAGTSVPAPVPLCNDIHQNPAPICMYSAGSNHHFNTASCTWQLPQQHAKWRILSLDTHRFQTVVELQQKQTRTDVGSFVYTQRNLGPDQQTDTADQSAKMDQCA